MSKLIPCFRYLFYMLAMGILMSLNTINSLKISDKVEVNWHKIMDVEELVADQAKPVFIDFSASWCGWCKVMDTKTFSKTEVATSLNTDFYAVKVDYDSQRPFRFLGQEFTGYSLAKYYGVTGLPTMIFLSSDLKKSKSVVGYKNVDQFLAKLKRYRDL